MSALTAVANSAGRYVNSINGLAQAANFYYFLHTMVSQTGRIFSATHFEARLLRYEFFPVIVAANMVACVNRVCKLFFQENQLKKKGWNLAEEFGIGLYSIFKCFLSPPHCNTFADFFLGIPLVINGFQNLRAEESFSDQRTRDLNMLEEELLLLEVHGEYSQDLWRSQMNFKRQELTQLHTEFVELREILMKEGALEKEIAWLESLQKLIALDDDHRKEKSAQLTTDKDNIAITKEQRATMEAEIYFLKLLLEKDNNSVKSLVKDVEDKIVEKKREKADADREGTVVPQSLKDELELFEQQMKGARFIENRSKITQRIEFLKKMQLYPRKLTLKMEQLNSLILLLAPFVAEGAQRPHNMMLLRKEQRRIHQLFLTLAASDLGGTFKAVKLDREIGARLYHLSLLKLAEEIISKLAYSEILLGQLKETRVLQSTELDNEVQTMKDLMEQLMALTASAYRKKLAKDITDKKLSIDQIEDPTKIVYLEKDAHRLFARLPYGADKGILQDEAEIRKGFFDALTLVLNEEGNRYVLAVKHLLEEKDKNQDLKFDRTSIGIAQIKKVVFKLRETLEKEQADLLAKIEEARARESNSVDKNEKSLWTIPFWGSEKKPKTGRLFKKAGPFFKMGCGVALIVARIFQMMGQLIPNSKTELCVDIATLGYLATRAWTAIFYTPYIKSKYQTVFIKIRTQSQLEQ